MPPEREVRCRAGAPGEPRTYSDAVRPFRSGPRRLLPIGHRGRRTEACRAAEDCPCSAGVGFFALLSGLRAGRRPPRHARACGTRGRGRRTASCSSSACCRCSPCAPGRCSRPTRRWPWDHWSPTSSSSPRRSGRPSPHPHRPRLLTPHRRPRSRPRRPRRPVQRPGARHLHPDDRRPRRLHPDHEDASAGVRHLRVVVAEQAAGPVHSRQRRRPRRPVVDHVGALDRRRRRLPAELHARLDRRRRARRLHRHVRRSRSRRSAIRSPSGSCTR